MKHIISIVMLTTLGVQGLPAQHFMVSPLVEKTISGYEYGSVVTYRSKNHFGLGAFYQTRIHNNSEYSAVHAPFYGLQINVPMKQCEQIKFFANTRMGFINHRFAIIVPGIETEIRVYKTLSTGIGMSVRQGFISANTNIKIKL